MKKIISVTLVLLMLVVTSCGKTLDKDEIVIYHATDMHYISQQITDNGPEFAEMMANSDGKMTHYIEYIMNTFVDTVKETKPDYVLIGGDMTFNGEKLSHSDFVLKLQEIEQSGTQVLVIPGNHDIDYPFCFGFEKGYSYKVDRMTDEDFEEWYADFGLKQAYSRDKNSFSYFYKLTDKITLLALDSNRGGGNGVVNTETIKWMEKELKKIKKDTQIICLTHQNLLNHFPKEDFNNQYSIINNAPVLELFEKYGVDLNLSGHIHTQHLYSDANITDIATESMAVFPYNYGVLKCNSSEMAYHTESLDVDSWSALNGITDENLLNFYNYSKDFYIKSQINRSIGAIIDNGISEADRQILAHFFGELNTYYFPGDVASAYEYLTQTEGYKLWSEKGQALWHYDYVMSRMEEGANGIVHNKWNKYF